ncbi:hypothetical protein [Sedimentitalea todarodis]|uniref:SMP domain-containing protein n=1 Tax=Sedimentitalea todarodis TaxID=1631240 RepID=A0ABU3VCB7_9RHOB|nr:hypothetical protein [Sedimentitalea todarodis]MDU9003815.1 hypothetical protein [Sedimentitalea todarodis]
MNMNQVINMVVRILMRKAIHKGVNAGIGAASDFSRRRTASKDGEAQAQQNAGNQPNMTEQQRQAKRAVQMASRTSRITKL